jgi:hypothetical protein
VISVLLYGRNDSYGYNLHKRAAISLNCIAEVLTDPDDEILFVDYNTPDDFPTFPEAIQDTLTPAARRLIRILRVRPRHHQRFADRTHLVALEPVARNVGLRRSNTANRWILSTNTDMVFVPRQGRSLSEVAADLADGYYHLPRFEIPESLWESLDRLDAPGTIRRVEHWGRAFYLNEIVHAQDPAVRYDAPGDFQLMLRSDLFRIHGFDERMLLGWHVDSNIARRLYLVHGRIGDLIDAYYGYHCDHTRQVTPMHQPGSAQNSLDVFVDGITTPFVTEQEHDWGLSGETIEATTTDGTGAAYLRGLEAAVPTGLATPSHVRYTSASFDRIDYATPHVLPFLLDVLASYPRCTRIGWFAARPDLLDAFAAAWEAMGGAPPILLADSTVWLGPAAPSFCRLVAPQDIAREADIFVFDWGLPPDAARAGWHFHTNPAIRNVAAGFRVAVRAETERLGDRASLPRRFIGVNAINNRCETLVQTHIGAARSPLASRLRQGFLNRRSDGAQELLGLLSVGSAGRREPQGIVASAGVSGHVCFGPYLDLLPGWFRLYLRFVTPPVAVGGVRPAGRLGMEVISGPYLVWFQSIMSADMAAGEMSFLFRMPEALSEASLASAVEFRLSTDRGRALTLTSITLADARAPAAGGGPGFDWLPMLQLGEAGMLSVPVGHSAAGFPDAAVRCRPEIRGTVVYGPYVALLAGPHEAVFTLDIATTRIRPNAESAIVLDIVTAGGNRCLAARPVVPGGPGPMTVIVPFEVPGPEEDGGEPPRLECRVWSAGTLSFSVLSLYITGLSRPAWSSDGPPDGRRNERALAP